MSYRYLDSYPDSQTAALIVVPGNAACYFLMFAERAHTRVNFSRPVIAPLYRTWNEISKAFVLLTALLIGSRVSASPSSFLYIYIYFFTFQQKIINEVLTQDQTYGPRLFFLRFKTMWGRVAATRVLVLTHFASQELRGDAEQKGPCSVFITAWAMAKPSNAGCAKYPFLALCFAVHKIYILLTNGNYGIWNHLLRGPEGQRRGRGQSIGD